MMQLDLFPERSAVVEESEPVVDRVAAVLISSGLIDNEVVLGLGASLGCHPDADRLPSRLYAFPIEFVGVSARRDDSCALLLRHPALADMPLCGEIEKRTGLRPVWEPFDHYGREREQGAFWHAIDLMSDEHVDGFLETRHLSSERMIVNALCYAMDYGGLSTSNARRVLNACEIAEPGDQSTAFLASDQVYVTSTQQGAFVGMRRRDEAAVWGAIHGLEAKRFKRDRAGHLRFSTPFLTEKQAA